MIGSDYILNTFKLEVFDNPKVNGCTFNSSLYSESFLSAYEFGFVLFWLNI
jgi:hypothetical protein